MKKLSLFSIALLLAIGSSIQSFSQVITASTVHFAPSEDFSMEEWLDIETKFHDNVTMKNEFIIGAAVLYHYYTADNSEILFVSVYENWDDIPKADEKNDELIKAAWPDEEERKAFFEKQRSYYTNMHSDEIYSRVPNRKTFETQPDTAKLYYMRKSRLAFPEDGSREDFAALMKEYAENLIHKNKAVLAYYPMRHHYGADSRDFIEVFVVDSMADLDVLNKGMNDLAKEHWPDEEARKAFFKKFNRYFENWHGDYLYMSEPKLSK